MSEYEYNPGGRINSIVIVLILIGILIVMFWGLSENGKASDWITKDASTQAYKKAIEYAKGELKAPATAVFPSIKDSEVSVKREDNTQKYEVRGYVDSQNGFGALVRTNFTAVLEQDKMNDWKRIDLRWYRY